MNRVESVVWKPEVVEPIAKEILMIKVLRLYQERPGDFDIPREKALENADRLRLFDNYGEFLEFYGISDGDEHSFLERSYLALYSRLNGLATHIPQGGWEAEEEGQDIIPMVFINRFAPSYRKTLLHELEHAAELCAGEFRSEEEDDQMWRWHIRQYLELATGAVAYGGLAAMEIMGNHQPIIFWGLLIIGTTGILAPFVGLSEIYSFSEREVRVEKAVKQDIAMIQ